jgi:hypothetical protein
LVEDKGKKYYESIIKLCNDSCIASFGIVLIGIVALLFGSNFLFFVLTILFLISETTLKLLKRYYQSKLKVMLGSINKGGGPLNEKQKLNCCKMDNF